jgi:hypothetical protein
MSVFIFDVLFSNPFVDFYNQTIANDDVTLVSLNLVNDDCQIRGNTVRLLTAGKASFDDLALTCNPGTSTQLDFNAKDMQTIIDASFRYCKIGEKYSLGTCTTCPLGQVSVAKVEETCFVCPNHASCPGGDEINVDKGYWREMNNTMTIKRCPSEVGCLGGSDTDTQCEEGPPFPFEFDRVIVDDTCLILQDTKDTTAQYVPMDT